MDVQTCIAQLENLIDNSRSFIREAPQFPEDNEIWKKDIEALTFAISLIEENRDALVNLSCISVLAAYRCFHADTRQIKRFRLELIRLSRALAEKKLTSEDLLLILEQVVYPGSIPDEKELLDGKFVSDQT